MDVDDTNIRQREHHARSEAEPDYNDINENDNECVLSSAMEEDHERDRRAGAGAAAATISLRSCPRCFGRMHLGSISNLCSATLGAGALSLPFAMSLTGIVFGTLLLIFSAYLTIISIDVIIEACARTQLFKYEDVSVQLVGKSAGRVLEASLLIFCFGTAVAYIVAVGDILDQGLRSLPFLWGKDSDGNQYGSGLTSMYSREHIMILFWALVMFPLSLKRLEALERFSLLGVFSVIFLVISSVIHSVIHGDVIGSRDETRQPYPTDIGSLLWPNSLWDVIRAFPIIIFAFSCQVNVCAIFEELRPAEMGNRDDINTLVSKQRTMAHITRNGILLCMTLYICIGLFGFLDFSLATLDNILNNYCVRNTHDPLMISASAFVAVAVVVAFPFNILPARVTLKLILERWRRRQRCRGCSSLNCRWAGLNVQSREENNYASVENVDVAASSPTAAGVNEETGDHVTDPLLSHHGFGSQPRLVPHMSLEGLPSEPIAEAAFSMDSSPMEHFFLTLLLSGSALIVALIIPGISVVFGLMGGTAASIISFILPGMFLSNDASRGDSDRLSRRTKRVLAPLLVWGGILVGFLSTGITIYGLFRESGNKVVDSCGSTS